MGLIEARNVCKVYNPKGNNPVVAIEDFSLEIQDKEFVSILGPSGCGKSTFLLLVVGLETLSSGELTIHGQPIRGPGVNRAIVFQEYLLFPWKTVLGNVAFGPEMKRVEKSRRDEIASRYIHLVGLDGFEYRYPHELSGGMKQRVALARALANEPEVLLMDEPFGALDALTRETMQQELLRIWQESKRTVLFVTHSINEAVLLSDRVVVMSNRPGKIIETLPIDLPRPRNRDLFLSNTFKEYELHLRSIVWAQQQEDTYGN